MTDHKTYYILQTADHAEHTDLHRPTVYKTFDEAHEQLIKNFLDLTKELNMLDTIKSRIHMNDDEIYDYLLDNNTLERYNMIDHNYHISYDRFWIENAATSCSEPENEDDTHVMHTEKISTIKIPE